jgi:hypothetical protein
VSARRAVLALATVSVLIASAISASSASAATSGTTAFTCSAATSSRPFADEHCLTRRGGESNAFGHVAIPAGKATAIAGTNAKTGGSTTTAVPAVLTGTIAGVATELTCTTSATSGSLENSLVGEVHFIQMSGAVISYTGCTMAKPTAAGCSIKEGKITTNSLKATTSGSSLLFEPTTGTELGKVTFEGCKIAGFNNTFSITGTVPATPNGATLEVTRAATEATLKFAGQKAGLAQVETLRAKEGNPIVATPSPFTTR